MKKYVLLGINKILFFVLAFSFICCQNKNEKIIIKEIVKENHYLGEWFSVKRVYPFGAILKIDSNNSFTYKGGACVRHFYSKGSWTLRDDTLILNSYEPEGCYSLKEFVLVGGIIINIDSNGVERVQRPVSIEGCEPESEKDYIIFNQEKLLIIDSILTHIPNPNNYYIADRNNFTKTKK